MFTVLILRLFSLLIVIFFLQTFVGVLSLELGQPLGHLQDLLLAVLISLQLRHGLGQQAALLRLQLLGSLLHVVQVFIQQVILGLVQVVQETV